MDRINGIISSDDFNDSMWDSILKIAGELWNCKKEDAGSELVRRVQGPGEGPASAPVDDRPIAERSQSWQDPVALTPQ